MIVSFLQVPIPVWLGKLTLQENTAASSNQPEITLLISDGLVNMWIHLLSLQWFNMLQFCLENTPGLY